jgi:hypothetical protein
MSIKLGIPSNGKVLSKRNIRRKSEKYLKKQLGENTNKEELMRKLDNGEIKITGLISKR